MKTALNFEELDAILVIIENQFNERWGEMCEITGFDVVQCREFYEKLSELRDEV